MQPDPQPRGSDGAIAHGLIQASDGNFYGTTQISSTTPFYPGVVYQLTPAGVQTTLYTFCTLTDCADGWDIFTGVVQDNDGNFYGTSYNGGSYNEGTVYKLTPAGVFTLLHTFAYGTDGAQPGGLVQAGNGILFGPSTGTTRLTVTDTVVSGNACLLYTSAFSRNFWGARL